MRHRGWLFVFNVLVMLLAISVHPAGAEENASAEPARFDIWEFQIEGTSLLPATKLEKAVYPHLGLQRAIQDVEAARTAVENAYRDAGYSTVVVDIPEQAVDSGIVRLHVTESKVSKMRVLGSHYYLQGRIAQAVPSVAPGTTPRFPRFPE